ncbi:ABC transporter substrate binding protein [Cupriavidus sp. CuC1]|uniref:ABC transporter substrate binding protein n=1 Tax=Cupriavidus sp. CuC1 TaxID=3373131 RepID=UPI0037D2B623
MSCAKNATTTIPSVFAIVVDPVGDDLVIRLERPGANITGLTSFAVPLRERLPARAEECWAGPAYCPRRDTKCHSRHLVIPPGTRGSPNKCS